MTREEYIDRYKDDAVRATQGSGLFASVLLTQGIVESNNGNSVLSQKYHNHFGIKANSAWTGKRVNMQTNEVYNGNTVTIGDYFRVYDSDYEGFLDRTRFLTSNPRYAKAGVFAAKTPEDQIQALKNAGYATDPNYVTILTSVLHRYNLSAIDKVIEVAKKHVGLIALVFFCSY